MEPLTKAFDERLQEIDAYLDFLHGLEEQLQSGPPRIGNKAITTQQQKILYSSVYLQLYNLVEATATWCVEAVTEAAAKNGSLPTDLCDGLRREWVRHTARTHIELNFENRLTAAVDLCNRLMGALPVEDWRFARGLGNWDDWEIEHVTQRIGCELRISAPVLSNVKRKIRDDKAPLELVKDLRNRLAHGSISFAECGDGITVDDLKVLTERTSGYLREVVTQFQEYIDGFEYLVPGRRPTTGGPI